VTEAVFLGTGNFAAQERYWNSFVLDGSILVEPSPTSSPHLQRCGFRAGDLDAIVISHFHPDHTLGWPFLLLELVLAGQAQGVHPQYVVGPPGVEEFLRQMITLSSIPDVMARAERDLDLRFVEADGQWQTAGPLRLRGIEVEHVPYLQCFGYLLERQGRLIGYTGDVRPCAGLEELADSADVLVLECNGGHQSDVGVCHMDEDSVRHLRAAHPDTPFVLTHMGVDLHLEGIEGIVVPDDFERLTL
jgi:ribonuclease Z